MNQEKPCLECNRISPKEIMIPSTKTNSYGDEIQNGYLCRACFRKRVENRSKILLAASIGFGLFSLILILIIPLYLLVIQLYIEENFRYIIETYLSWAALMAIISFIMYYVRKREFNKSEMLLKRS